MRKKIQLLAVVLFLCSFSAFAQRDLLKFRVQDDKTKEPLEFCYVLLKGKNVSSQSNEMGLVEIAAQQSDTLVVYQLGYFIKKTTADEIIANGSLVNLRSKNITLQEVVVRSSQTDTFQNKNTIFFLDFEFYDDMILALVNKGGRFNSLLLLDQQGDKLSERQLSIKTDALFKDCFQTIHLITADSIYQVYYDYHKLRLLKPFHIKSYTNVLQPCECYYRSTFVLKARQYRSLKNTYYLFDEQCKTKEPQVMAVIADSSAIKGFNMDYDINYFLGLRRKGTAYRTSVTELVKHLDELREDLDLPAKYEQLLQPVASEMKRVDSVYVLFDYTNKQMQTFSLNGQCKTKTELTNFSGISPRLIIDQDTRNLIFSSLSGAGVLTLYRYDLAKNTFTHRFELRDFYFLKDFQVKENNLYFINKDRSESMTMSKIVKQYISWQSLTSAYKQ